MRRGKTKKDGDKEGERETDRARERSRSRSRAATLTGFYKPTAAYKAFSALICVSPPSRHDGRKNSDGAWVDSHDPPTAADSLQRI